MEFIVEHATNQAQLAYEAYLYWTIIGINLAFFCYSYWLLKLARLARRKRWEWGFRAASAVCLGIGLWRMIAVVGHYDDYQTRIVIPLTAVISWAAITIVFWAIVRWCESAAKRLQTSAKQVDLMDEIQTHIVEPVLRGDNPSSELIEEYQVKSAELSAKVFVAAGAK